MALTPQKYPPVLLKYLKMFQDDPTSRIFAPLAESYRKMGLADEAIEICKEGLEHHPDFTGGLVALARAYSDKRMYGEVKATLKKVVDELPDNLMAQRLYAEACLSLAEIPEALSALKMILYFNPNDMDALNLVTEIENQTLQNGGIWKSPASQTKFKKISVLQQMLEKVQSYRRDHQSTFDR